MIKRLYVIGNGFDRHHDINSSYCDFRAWMCENVRYDAEDIESLFDCDELWKSFEENLSKLRYDVIARQKTAENPPNIADDHFERTLSDARCEVENDLEGWYAEIRKALPRWVEQLNAPNPLKRVDLKIEDSVFLTFNYTKTLEDFYGVPDDVVLHVHGKLGDQWQNLLLGHGGDVDSSYLDKTADEGPLEDEEWNAPEPEVMLAESDAIQAGYEVVKQWQKPVDAVVGRLDEFFRSLADVDEVFVLGLSFSSVDMAYINRIANSIRLDAHWHISYLSAADASRIKSLEINNRFFTVDLITISQLLCVKSPREDQGE